MISVISYPIDKLDEFVSLEWWDGVAMIKDLPIAVIDKYWDKLKEIERVYVSQYLPTEFIEKHENDINWYVLSFTQLLTMEQIEKHKFEVSWNSMFIKQKLPDWFWQKHRNLQFPFGE